MFRSVHSTLSFALASLLPAAPAAAQAPTWTRVTLDAAFRSEGVAVADVDRDGDLDVLAGELWYEAPLWDIHELAPPGIYDQVNGYSDCFVAAADDVDGDGWPDLLSVGFPGGEARWYRNPQNASGHWQEAVIAASVSNESPAFADVDGDGRLDLVFGLAAQQRVVWAEAGTDPTQPWTLHAVSAPGQPGSAQFYHGLGFADLDGDGRRDVLTPEGWYRAPADPRSGPWRFQRADLMGTGPNGVQMAAQIPAFDLDGDGDADAFSSAPHDYGAWWWEQTSQGFVEHLVLDHLSQTHALVAADIDGDGLQDLVTGKRWYAHGPSGDPGSQEPALLLWCRATRVGGTASFQRPLPIHRDTGVGTQFVVRDMDADGRLDIVTSNKKGVHVHLQGP